MPFPACVQPRSQHSLGSAELQAALSSTCPHESRLEGALMQAPPWLFRGDKQPRALQPERQLLDLDAQEGCSANDC